MTSIFLICCCLFACNFAALVDFSFGGRSNKLYIPSNPRPHTSLFVMLHGCTQDPLDFSRGTDMGKFAEEHGFYVLFPLQPSSSNMNKCWNWFLPEHQKRNSGEPKLISDMTKAVMSKYDINPASVSVSGLSAGAAMSVIMGVTYPDLYCCVASAAGLEFKAATSMVSAFTAMTSGGPAPTTQGKLAYTTMKDYYKAPIQAVIFQGTKDYTVFPVNGEQTTLQWVIANDLALSPGDRISTTPSSVEDFQVPNGYKYKVKQYDDTQLGIEVVKLVIVEGMGHAWSGGKTTGSYTDPKGPSMSQMIVDTFLTWEGEENTLNRTI